MTTQTTRAVLAMGTRSQLVSVGRLLFAERGFGATSTEEIVLRAGVTRGALYYHFRNKQDLFRAVFAAVEEAVFEQVTSASMAEPDPWAGLLAGCSAFIAASLDPAVQQIVLIDAPAVLGWETWRQAGSENILGLLVTGMHWAMAAGQIEDQPAVPLAHVLLGALNEGALFIAGAKDRSAARDQVTAVVFRLLAGLRPT